MLRRGRDTLRCGRDMLRRGRAMLPRGRAMLRRGRDTYVIPNGRKTRIREFFSWPGRPASRI